VYTQKGFSLIEIMIVLAIMGALLGMITTNMDFLVPSSRINACAREIASTIMLAHNRATINGEDAILSYHLDNNTYQLMLMKNGKVEHFKPWKLAEGVTFQDILAEGERKKTGGIFEVYFAPNGIVRGHVVHLQNKDQKILSIEVNPLSGDVQVMEGYQKLNFQLKN
jgi:type II secretion system protein H